MIVPEKPMTRAELYELIWNEPMVRAAARFGISDVALRRICERHDIPRPAPGYWAKISHGKTGERIPLPTTRFGRLDKIRLSFVPRKY